MNVEQVVRVLRRAWWLPILGLLLGGVLGLGVSLVQQPLYTSSMQLFVASTEATSTTEALQGGQFSQQRVDSYARLLTSDDLARRVREKLDLPVDSEKLREQITASAVPNTVLLTVSVTDPSPEQAQRIAAAIGDVFPKIVADLERPADGGVPPVTVSVADQPEVELQPSSPRTLRNVALGLLLGLAAGGAVAVTRARLDRSVTSADLATEVTGAPVIGTVLQDSALEKRHVVDRAGGGRTAEDYRQLRTNLQFLNVDEPPKVIMVSSAVPAEGKTTVVVNLGLALADAGRRVTIIEADLRKPKVTRYLGMVGGAGLTNILAGTADVDEVIQSYGAGELRVIGAGPTPPNPGELLSSSHMATLVDKLRGENDFVLVDAPPLLPVADASGLAVIMDGVLLSVRYGSTTKDQLRQAALNLERVGAKTLGLILNIVPPRAELASAYGYGYNYEAEAAPRGGKRRA